MNPSCLIVSIESGKLDIPYIIDINYSSKSLVKSYNKDIIRFSNRLVQQSVI